MPVNTNQGKAYSIEELIKLGSLGSFGSYNGAVLGALHQIKAMQLANERLNEENKRLKGLLDESMNKRFERDTSRE